MGCGASSAAGVTLSKDPEDFHLEALHFSKMKVPDFDAFLCDEVEPVVNQVVEIVNTINGCIDDIKDAASVICGAFKVSVALEGAREHDTVVLALLKADGKHPSVDEALKLVADAKVLKADAELSKAGKALDKAMEAAYVSLSLAGDALSAAAPTPAVDAFNKALAEMRSALGGAYKISVVVKTAGAGGAPCVRATLSKAVFANPDSEDYTMEPVSLLDVAKSKDPASIFTAEQSVAVGLAGLTKAVKEVEALGVNVSFELKKKRLAVKMEGGEEGAEGLADKKSAVRKALTGANSALFKLFKSATNANGAVTIAKALVQVFEELKKKLLKQAKDITDIKGIIALEPKIKITIDGDVDFDLGLKVKLPAYEGKDTAQILDMLLPGSAKLVWHAILAVKDKLVELFPEFKTLAEQVTEMVERAPTVFEEPTQKIKEAFGETEDAFAVPKAAAAAAKNLKIVTVDPVKIVATMKDTVMRLSDELNAAVTELKTQFA